MYRVYYMNQFRKSFPTRDAAMEWIYATVEKAGGRYAVEDYEILDGSDFL